MDSLLAASTDGGSKINAAFARQYVKAEADSHVINSISDQSPGSAAVVDMSVNDLYKGLSVAAKNVIDRLNELLVDKVPKGIQSLNPEDFTPEKTADRIVTQVSGLFAVFSRRHPELAGEELVSGFMETIRAGVHQGYNEAFGILENLGAFDFDNVKSGVEQTKTLIDEKLNSLEAHLRKQLGIADPAAQEAGQAVKAELAAQGGSTVLQGS